LLFSIALLKPSFIFFVLYSLNKEQRRRYKNLNKASYLGMVEP